MNIILFNGPPRSGKDTAAMFLYEQWHNLPWTRGDCVFDRMSMPNKFAFAGTTATECDDFGNNTTYERIKEDPLKLLNGKSYRQWQIDFSESFMKPLYGEDIFARLLASRLYSLRADYPVTAVIPDCGFQVEADKLSRFLDLNIVLIRIHRRGCDFSGDSRGYIEAPKGVQFFSINNDGTKEDFEWSVSSLLASVF